MTGKFGRKRLLPYLLGFLIVSGVSGGIYSLIQYVEKPIQTRKSVQQISIIQPPPPPPPAEPPPPPPEIEEEVKIPEPEEIPEDLPDAADEPPAGDLGLDAEGGAGSDGFGLAARKGGRGLLGGGGGDPKTRFASVLKRQIEDVLNEYDDVRSKNYRIVVSFRISETGQLHPALKGSTGDKNLDSTIQKALLRIVALSQQPPSDVLGKTIQFRIGV
ncbi:MAG: TonB C-terminal domain-containing protein [Methylococcales bacterium]